MLNRFRRIFAFTLMLVTLLAGMNLTASAATYSSGSSSNSFSLLNMSGHSITEIYFYPSYNKTWGNARNRGWIYNGREATLSFTNAEMRLNTDWSMRIGFDKGRYVSYALWEGISPSDLVESQNVTVIANDMGGFTLDYGETTHTGDDNEFTILNMTGLAITEVYFYPISNSAWGNPRNREWIYNGGEETMRFSYNELGLNVEWCMTLGLNRGRYVSYITWEGLTLADFVNCDYINIYANGDGYTISFEDDNYY